MSAVDFTRHATDKFDVLKRRGFVVAVDQVEQAVLHPDKVIPQPGGRFIAQKRITEHHVLRVVYRQEGDTSVVITFYPGRRERYETPL